MSKRSIAFFDFDGTITTNDSLLQFIRFAVGDARFLTGLIVLLPIFASYKLKLLPNYKAKQIMLSWYFKGLDEQIFKKIANKYSLKYIDTIVRDQALKRLLWHKKHGHKIVLVSASIECWLRPWCEKNDFELLATQLEIKDGIVTGNLLSKNCHGQEKVNRIKNAYDLKAYDYIYAYGDSAGDSQMLELAHEKFFKPFQR